MPPKPRPPALHIEFPPPLHEALRRVAYEDRCSISEAVRRFCAQGVAKRPAPKEVGK